VGEVHRAGPWLMIGIFIPTVVERGPDVLYAPVYAKLENGLLSQWTTERPAELDRMTFFPLALEDQRFIGFTDAELEAEPELRTNAELRQQKAHSAGRLEFPAHYSNLESGE
jgi:hypothetical protein